MNLLLFSQDSVLHSEQNISDKVNSEKSFSMEIDVKDQRQIDHLQKIHRAKIGDTIRVGMINGLKGQGEILSLSQQEARLKVLLNEPSPNALPLQLLLGLPRPKMLKRCLQSLASLGVKKIYFINSFRVEKSYWQTPWLEPDLIREQLILGLEQACDTAMPEVHLIKLFKPFVEDELKKLVGSSEALVAHPYTAQACPTQVNRPITLAIGPEGGFIPYEINLLEQQGFKPVHLGERILRVETAVPFILGSLFKSF